MFSARYQHLNGIVVLTGFIYLDAIDKIDVDPCTPNRYVLTHTHIMSETDRPENAPESKFYTVDLLPRLILITYVCVVHAYACSSGVSVAWT